MPLTSPIIPHLKETGHRPQQLFKKLSLLLVEHCGGGQGQTSQATVTVKGSGLAPSPAVTTTYQTGKGTPGWW